MATAAQPAAANGATAPAAATDADIGRQIHGYKIAPPKCTMVTSHNGKNGVNDSRPTCASNTVTTPNSYKQQKTPHPNYEL